MAGNITNFTSYDVLRVFLSLDSHISRQSLVKKLDIGEGTMRSILDRLKEKSLIDSSRSGHKLTDKGEDVKARLLSHIVPPKNVSFDYMPRLPKSALVVKTSQPLSVGMSERDTAIKHGAEACLLFIYDKDKGLHMPQHEHGFNMDNIHANFDLSHNDILVLSAASSVRWAEISAFAVAGKINPELDHLIRKSF